MDRELTAESASRLLFFECSRIDLEWWTTILNTLAETREHEPVKVQMLMNTLAEVIPGVGNMHVGDLIAMDLTLGEQCFVAAALDCFMDQWICTAGATLSEWTERWGEVSGFLTRAGTLIRNDPRHIDASGMNEVWNQLRAAVS